MPSVGYRRESVERNARILERSGDMVSEFTEAGEADGVLLETNLRSLDQT